MGTERESERSSLLIFDNSKLSQHLFVAHEGNHPITASGLIIYIIHFLIKISFILNFVKSGIWL